MIMSLSVSNLSKVYPSGRGIHNISFDLKKGSILGIIGLNGAGKTTLLSCLAGFINKDSGDISYTFDNANHRTVSADVLENLGIVFSEYGFPGHFSAKTICSIMSKSYKKWSSETFYALLSQLELDRNLVTKKYSTGMKTKLAIAIALSHNAKILILDEATNGLDAKSSAKVRNLMSTFVSNRENSIIITSHIMGEIERMSDYIMFIDNGHMKFNCSKDELLQRYKGSYVTLDEIIEALLKGEVL